MATRDEETGLGEGCLAVVMLLVAVPMQALVFLTLWRWFVVPLGAPPLSFWHAAGLGALVHYLAPTPTSDGKPVTKAAFAEATVRFVIKPTVAVGIGALAHWGMR